ncbi:type III-B CRISPR module RAMP protein Cmr6 [Paenibacillus sp. NPDC058071]|uniref:type III-B CRISPR module RAMP protein Cmr6 n=1 Tax=Paenibacillus sp. NPDC058071 TaxID=3346326 RepID=UPI0036DC6AD7
MNLRLALTKSQKGRIEEVVKNGDRRAQFYEETLKEYVQNWKVGSLAHGIYSTFFDRYYSGLQHTAQTEIFYVKTASPLVIGNGGQSVLEAHLTLHHTYGVPYLPGTAIKGVAAHYCHRYLSEDENFKKKGLYHKVLFGSQEAAAKIIYYDALPLKEKLSETLRLDVLTPHHQKYYQAGHAGARREIDPPRDDDSPIPVHFLSVKGQFQMALGWGGEQDDPEAQNWLRVAQQIVLYALEQEGIGGKTNTGYGRIVRVSGEEGTG